MGPAHSRLQDAYRELRQTALTATGREPVVAALEDLGERIKLALDDALEAGRQDGIDEAYAAMNTRLNAAVDKLRGTLEAAEQGIGEGHAEHHEPYPTLWRSCPLEPCRSLIRMVEQVDELATEDHL